MIKKIYQILLFQIILTLCLSSSSFAITLNKIEQAKLWARILINASSSLNGNYYLPYQPFATVSQFQKEYHEYNQFIKIKNEYDPKALFRNEFYLTYIHQQQ